MDLVAIIVGAGWMLGALAIIGASVPLLRGRVPRNRIYGIRLRQSLASDEAWYEINRFGGKRLIAWAIPMLAVGFGCLLLRLHGHAVLTLVLGFGPLVFLLIPAIQTWRFARRFMS
ncbi:MAG TPA: SdpI family protein [Tepidisphaeraceae bacterium]|jgi:hypothetical protein